MFQNWAACTTTTTGTGALTLSSISGWPTINDVAGTGRPFRYAILDDSTGAPLAAGIGSLSASTTMDRGAVETTYSSGTYTQAGSVLSLASGTKRVIVTALAEDMVPAIPNVQNAFGQRLVLPDGLDPSNNNKTIIANTMYLSCLRLNVGRAVGSLACKVTTAAGTGTDRIQLGIYACGADGLPGNLIARTGDIAPNSTGYKTAVLTSGNILLPAAWYWFAICSNVGPAMNAYNAGSPANSAHGTPMGHTASDLPVRYGFFTATVSGGWTALPSTVTLASASTVSSDFPPIVGVLLA